MSMYLHMLLKHKILLSFKSIALQFVFDLKRNHTESIKI